MDFECKRCGKIDDKNMDLILVSEGQEEMWCDACQRKYLD